MRVSRHWIFFKLDQLVLHNFQVIANMILDFFPSACWNIHFEYCIHGMFPLTLYFYKYSGTEGRVIRTVKKHWPELKPNITLSGGNLSGRSVQNYHTQSQQRWLLE